MSKNTIEISFLHRQLAIILTSWGLTSIVMGVTLLFFDVEFLRSLSIQFLIWGAVNFLLGIFPLIRNSVPNRKRLYKILLINSFLDVIYLIVGILLVLQIFFQGESAVGHGFGVVVQGLFLLVFDTYYGLKFKTLED
ncbi:MAG: hypothetical protein CL773_02315 [Chloroflexi bacterium]|nr:hypothetical protein [Chloroflexota bacterium]|tara:strand:+ start:16201 stop:16611 length:411 start_codon:yes stop_codon:yes gene_type:complete